MLDRKRSLEHGRQTPSSPTATHEHGPLTNRSNASIAVQYRLYKARFAGCIGLVRVIHYLLLYYFLHSFVQVVLNGATAMSWPWFGPIANNS